MAKRTQYKDWRLEGDYQNLTKEEQEYLRAFNRVFVLNSYDENDKEVLRQHFPDIDDFLEGDDPHFGCHYYPTTKKPERQPTVKQTITRAKKQSALDVMNVSPATVAAAIAAKQTPKGVVGDYMGFLDNARLSKDDNFPDEEK